LMSLARLVIRQQVGKEGIEEGDIEQLNLPKTIKNSSTIENPASRLVRCSKL